MFRCVTIAAFAAVIALPAAPAFAAECVKITAERVNVRSSPNGNCLGSLSRGTKFKLTSTDCTWCKFSGQIRYIKKSFQVNDHTVKSFGPAKNCGKQPALRRCT